jgi:HPt (histidine-containing phosphotransfer) domain-containing protein
MIGRHAQHVSQEEEQDHRLIQMDYLNQLSGGDKEFERNILEQFLVQMPEELKQLEEALNDNNFDTARQTAHTLKSTVGYVGLTEELHPYLERIEKGAADGAEKLAADFTYVKTVCFQAKEEVQDLLRKEAV